jgi:hypothetical protein
MQLWDFGNRDRNEILAWARELSKRDRAALNQKLDVLERIDFQLARGLKLLAGPIHKTGHILRLRAFGDTALRPLLCRGPDSPRTEYTLLKGAQERDDRLRPPTALKQAMENRTRVEHSPHEWRVYHERP